MIYIDEIKDLKLYKRQFLLPRNGLDKKHSNVIMLLTPNNESSIKLINHKLMKNKYYRCYWLEKDVSFYINNENALDYINHDNEVYIHESEEGDWNKYVNEAGVFSYYKSKIIYNGYKQDVDRVRKYINTATIGALNADLHAKVKYPISVTVFPHEPNIETDAKSIIVSSEFADEDLQYHCKEEICTMLVRTINPDISDVILEPIVMVLAGSYDKYKGMLKPDGIQYRYLCEAVMDIISKDRGWKDLYDIIKKNDINDFTKRAANTNKILGKYINEAKMDPVAKLKRKVTYTSRKGSAHKINTVLNNIEKTVDTTVDNPEFKEANDIAKKDREKKEKEEIIKKIDVPNIDADHPAAADASTPESQEETYYAGTISDEYILTEDYLQTKEGITYFMEASDVNNAKLKKILYRERLRTNKQVLNIYDNIKNTCPSIKYTYLNLNRYKKQNLIVDLRFYNELFFKNNMYKLDKGIDLYFSLLSKMINSSKLTANGYNKKKVVFIPVNDWDIDPNTKMWLYNKDINPVSMFYRLMVKKFYILRDTFDNTDFVFINDDAYFKINFSTFKESDKARFLVLINKLRSGTTLEDEGDENKDTTKAIVDTIIDNIEDAEHIKISHLTGDNETMKKKEDIEEKPASADPEDEEKKKVTEKKKEDLVKTIELVAKDSSSVDDTMEKLNQDEYFKKILDNLADEEDNGIQINNSRKTRMETLDNDFLKKNINGKTVEQILDEKRELNSKDLEVTAIPIDSINKEWQELTYTNASKMYDPADDIVAMIYALHNKTYPLSVRDISVQDASTSEDYIFTYIVELESHTGKRFKIKFDIPKLKNGQYMVLRGNKKVISSQSFLMPVLKSDPDAAQLVSNYSKIFIYTFGSSTGKTNAYTDRLIKTLTKNEFKNIKVVTGDNSKICDRYDVPIDYIDLSKVFTKIITPRYEFYFNQKALREEYADKIDCTEGFPIAVDKSRKNIVYNMETSDMFLSEQIYRLISIDDKEFDEAFKKTKPATKYMYSKASILSTEIPVIVLTAYSEGMTEVLRKAGVAYKLVEKKGTLLESEDLIKFNDGYLIYHNTPQSSMLMNGLKECNTESYSVGDINSKSMYLDFLDNYGGRLKADGIDNFYDCMIDPITEDILDHYGLPKDYVSLLLYASNLMTDNKYYKHGDQSVRRIRRNEIIAGYTYKALTNAYGRYSIEMKHGRDSIMTMKQSAVIDLILLDPSSSDTSFLNPLAEMESYNTVTTKGLSGMNSDRSYSVDKRSYDDSMVNVLGMSTAFAGTVGINRQATINSNISTVRGYVKPSKIQDMNSVNSLCMTEALMPMGTTRDDPFRTAMTFIQTSKHTIRVKHSDPCLITNGASAALPYMISDEYAHKAKDNGEVVEKEDDFMIIEYKDGTADYVDLSNKIEKNSASGFYQVIKLDTDLKVGSKVKKNDIIAYDHLAFNNRNGMNNDLEYNIGTLVKCALMDTDEGFEDSAIISDDLSEAMTSDVVVKKEINLAKETMIYKLLEPGTHVEEGDIIATIQSPYDEDDANALLKTLVDDPEEISNLGRINITSKVTGVIEDIEIYRTVELDELSESLQKICKKYESKIKHKKALMKKYNIDKLEELPPDYKLESTGKLKGTIDGVQIVFYLKYRDKMSVGDKLVYWSANKGVVKDIFPKGKEPYFLSEPDEKVHTLVSIASVNGRMVSSIQNVGIIQNLLVEATKKAKDMAGIKYDYNKID